MRMSQKPSMGRTPHIYADEWIYFITARTKDKKHLFDTYEKKQIFIRIWNNLTKEYSIIVHHWILWSNHYHALAKIPVGETLHNFINRLHAITATLINRNDGQTGRKVWQQYWDHCVRNEVDFWKHFNYITNNPIKHGWCDNFEKAFQCPFSGNPQWVKQKGKDFLYTMMREYPIRNFAPEQVENSLKTLRP